MAKISGCSICGRVQRTARGVCMAHYSRLMKYGDAMFGGDLKIIELRAIEIKDGVGYVPLSQGKFALIDADDVDVIGSRNWHAVKDDVAYYAFSSDKTALHNAIMGKRDGFVVDHINGDGLDNRKSNLRFATMSQNQWNSRIPKSNKTGFKGVRFANWAGGSKKWRAGIHVSGHHKSLGYFESPELAAQAYDDAAIKYFGEFAKLNQSSIGGHYR